MTTFPYYPGTKAVVYNGESLTMMRQMPDNCIDAVVTDPPYGLSSLPPALIVKALTAWLSGDRDHVPAGRGFMGNAWDAFVPPPAAFDECMRVLKPGGHLLCFAGSRTVDLMAMSIRLAGFEIRDSIAWLYGSGFPKSLDVPKAIDKTAGAEREVVGQYKPPAMDKPWNLRNAANQRDVEIFDSNRNNLDITSPATEAAQQWQGWGTALKPAFESIVVGRKPFPGTVAANVVKHGTGALNIDGCRITGTNENARADKGGPRRNEVYGEDHRPRGAWAADAGRWPTNVVLDESQAAELDAQTGTLTSGKGNVRRESGADRAGNTSPAYGAESRPAGSEMVSYGDSGGASRFFPVFKYQAKASAKERPKVDGIAHPTVKPLELMRWLVRLVTPPDGVVLDFCAGSGTTLEAAILEGFHAIGIEREAKYLPLIFERIRRSTPALNEATA